MFDIGFAELLLISIIGLLILGPERLPQAARKAGLWIGRIRRMIGDVSQEIDRQIKAEELRERLEKEGDQLGLNKIQETVDDALAEAKKFEQYVDQDVSSKSNDDTPDIATKPASLPKESADLPEEKATTQNDRS